MPETPHMFENVISPAHGTWIRIAPWLSLVAIVLATCLAFAGVVSAVRASQVVASLRQDARERPMVFVQFADPTR